MVSTYDILKNFANASDELLRLNVIRTDSFTGEIGEYVASKYFNLTLSSKTTKDIDAIDEKDNKYQIKSKVIEKDSFSYKISGLNPKAFKYLIVVYLDNLYQPVKILKINSNVINGSEYSISTNISMGRGIEVIEKSKIKLPSNVKTSLRRFAELYNDLRKKKVIRSRHIVGDLGEHYACEKMGLVINTKVNEKGIDARHPSNGLTFEVKTRRVYSSERRNGEGRRLNNLEGKTADYLIVVVLDREFKCAGMWIIPMANITNPKSAHLTIVNDTPGTKNIIPSKIEWLRTGEKFKGFNKAKSYKNVQALSKSSEKLTVPKSKNRNPLRGPRKLSWMKNLDNLDDEESQELIDQDAAHSYQKSSKQIKPANHLTNYFTQLVTYLLWIFIAYVMISFFYAILH